MTEDTPSSTHPPLPPTTEDIQFSWLRLLRSRRVGPVTFYRLMAEYGTAQNALAALPELARTAGVKRYEICPEGAVEHELQAAKAAKARLLCAGSPEYPKILSELHDAPPLLWAIGDLSLLKKTSIALVGARNASSLGVRMARALARELGEAGFVTTSGLARGIDAAAHEAAMEAGTIAVVAGGVDVIYPSEHADLTKRIAEHGLILSEQPMGLAPQARHFPKRNRIIAGLARALIVVEAAARSGSLITARDTLDLGREVLAVPGHPFDARAAGCNLLIRDGATLVRNGADVIAALPPATHHTQSNHKIRMKDLPQSPPEKRNLRETNALHQQILARLGPTPTAEDQLIRDISAPARDIAPVLTELELSGEIDRSAGGLLSRQIK